MKYLLLIAAFICIIILSVFGIPALLESILGTEQPVLTVTSSSMWPELSRGDIVFVKETNIDDIEVGSVIVFHHENAMWADCWAHAAADTCLFVEFQRCHVAQVTQRFQCLLPDLGCLPQPK